MTDREKEKKAIRQLASNIRKYGKKETENQYEYMIDDIRLLGSNNGVTMCRVGLPVILLDTGIVKPDWLEYELILNRSSIYKIINIIKEHNEFKLLEGIE